MTDSITTETAIAQLRAQHAAWCDALYATYPGQEINRKTYDAFRRDAKLGKAKRRIRFAGAAVIERGSLVLFAPNTVEPTCVSVWAPGISALVDATKIAEVVGA